MYFNPLSLCRERPVREMHEEEARSISIHSLFAERDVEPLHGPIGTEPFQSTLSLQRETVPRGADGEKDRISIHSLFAERDLVLTLISLSSSNFNPLSLCRERPLRLLRATRSDYFNPLSLCRERRKWQLVQDTDITISIHSLFAERDAEHAERAACYGSFQSTLSLQRETLISPASPVLRVFQSTLSLQRETYFKAATSMIELFQSTLSLQRETRQKRTTGDNQNISIHSLFAERDVGKKRRENGTSISIHSLFAERDNDSV